MGVLKVKVGGQWVDIGSGMPLYSGRNLLDNGQHAVKQRSIVTTPLTGAVLLADRWVVTNTGIGVTSLNYIATSSFAPVPAGRPRPGNIQYIHTSTAEAAGSLAAGDNLQWSQAVEGQNVQHLNWGTPEALPLTYSFDIYSPIATTYAVELVHFETTPRSISSLITVPVGFSTQVVTFPGDTAAPITNDSAARLFANVWLGAGANYAGGTLLTSWGTLVQANRAVGISNAFAATVGNQFALVNCQLEVGAQATPYEVARYDDDLYRCMRYFERFDSSNQASFTYFGAGQAYSTNAALIPIRYRVEKRANPTIVHSTGNTFGLLNASATVIACTGVSSGSVNRFGYTASAVVASGLVIGNAAGFLSNNVTTASIEISAEI